MTDSTSSSVTTEAQTVTSTVTSKELVAYKDVTEALDKWTIPNVKPEKIYKIGTFDFFSKRIIKTFEHQVPLQNNDEILYLLDVNDLYPFLNKYKYVHIGLVQIAFKPLTLLGQNTSIQTTLRDGRCLDWRQSLMGAVETSLSHGPVYFDIYPNLSIALSDNNLSKVLELRVLTHGYNYLPGSLPFAIIFRVHLKVLTTLNPYIRKQTNQGQTVLIETNLFSSQVAVPRMIPWDSITFPERWKVSQAVPVRPIIRQSLDDVIQTRDGNVFIQFKRPLQRSISSTSYRIPSQYNVELPESSRHSTADPLEFITKNSSNDSNNDLYPEDQVRGIHVSENQIPHGIYQNRRPSSPSPSSASEMQFPV